MSSINMRILPLKTKWPRVEIFWKCENMNITPWCKHHNMARTSCHYKSIFLRQECQATTNISFIDGYSKSFHYGKKNRYAKNVTQSKVKAWWECHDMARPFDICPKWLTVHSGYKCFGSMCVPWELNPQTFALLTQCSTTEPQEHYFCVLGHRIRNMPQEKFLATSKQLQGCHTSWQVPCYVKSVRMKNVKSSEENHTMVVVWFFFHNKSIILV